MDLLRQNQSSESKKEIKYTYIFEIITCDPYYYLQWTILILLYMQEL